LTNAEIKLAAGDLRQRIVGVDRQVPLLDGTRARYVNLDNAASTPPLQDVVDAVNTFLPYYSSVHRGTGFKSRLSTRAYERAHEVVAHFVNADIEANTVIFGKNTTEAINKLSYRYPMSPDSVVITSQLEHHSNDLPWRSHHQVVHVAVDAEGKLDEDDFDRQLANYAGRIGLVAVSGASNVTGYVQPVHRLAEKAHRAGAPILVDAAQLAPHRAIDMRPQDDPKHLDFLALSAHKMYAPFGTGALIGPKEIFLRAAPEYRGGGTVDIVTLDEVEWAGTPDRDEAGSPNVIGAVALAAACQALGTVGMDAIEAHERRLLAYAWDELDTIPGIRMFGPPDPADEIDKVGVITFNLGGLSHFKVAAILGYEGGIGVRSGCFCAHPYVVHLLDLSPEQSSSWRQEIRRGNRANMPGMVRISLGCYNNQEDVDRAVEMLHQIARGDIRGDYVLDPASGEYTPAGFQEPVEDYFEL
jgi:cysteine desulfurase/selenocysteine lyase